MALALASFQRSLVSAESRFDKRQLTPKELRGEALFFGKARCSSCHAGPNFTDEMFHHIALDNGAMGRAAVTKRADDAGRLKTPTLRDIALTAPYFRDGSKETLEAVVDHYNTAGMNSTAQDFELHPLGLKRAEKSELVAFLKTLTGSTLPMNRRGTPVGNLQLIAGGGSTAIWLVVLGFSADTVVQIAWRETDAPFISLRGRQLNIAHGVSPTGWSGAWDRITFSKPARLRSMNQFWVSIETNGRRTSPKLIKLRRE